jgi:16S rRNA processing protein RimM
MTVAASRADRDRVLLRFEGVNDRAAIERLRGALLSIATEEAAPAAPGSFYPHEIEGFAVIDPDGARLGVLARVLAGTANDVWVVDTGEGEVLVPAISDAVVSVDPVSATITVRPLPGLFE